LLDTYSLEPPQTYDDLVRIIETITAEQQDMSGFVWAGAREESLVQVWVEFFRGFGGQYFDAEGNCAINSEAGIAAVTFMRDLIINGYSPPETTSWTSQEARTRFVEGEAIFLRSNHDIVSWLDDPERSDIGGMWGVIPNPAQPDGEQAGATGGFAFAINPFTDNREEATQVLRVIASEEVQKGFAMAWGPVQYYEGLYDDPQVQEANPNIDAVERLLPSAATRPQSTDYAQLSDVLQQELHSALTESKPVEVALNDACSRIDAIE
jgi:multiple sugar transport system substrate-binding protein